MAYGLPAFGETDWHVKLNASIEAVKATADAAETPTGAQTKADAAEAGAVATAAADATSKADAAEAAAIATAATDATTKASQAEADANAYTDTELAAHVAAEHPAEDPWHVIGTAGEPAFQNGWFNANTGPFAGTTVAFRKEGNRVYLRGAPCNASQGSTIFTLPAGYRPEQITVWVNSSASSAVPKMVELQVGTNGDVKLFIVSGDNPGGWGMYLWGSFDVYGGS